MPSTYTPIATNTLSANTNEVTFSAIPQTYTDLVLEMSVISADYTGKYLGIQFNGDTTTNYSYTLIVGDGATAVSARDANSPYIYLSAYVSAMTSPVYPMIGTAHIFRYTSTSILKTVVYRSGQSQSRTMNAVGLWRKSPEAITSIRLYATSGNMAAGTTFSLYGVKAA